MTDEKLVDTSIRIAHIVYANIGVNVVGDFYSSLSTSINKMRGVKRAYEIISGDFSLLESGLDSVEEEEVADWASYIVRCVLQAYYGTNSAFAATPKSVVGVRSVLIEVLSAT